MSALNITSTNQYVSVRREICDYMRSEDGRVFVTAYLPLIYDANTNFDAYVAQMAMDGAWADAIVITCACFKYNIKIEILTPTSSSHVYGQGTHIILAYCNEHYSGTKLKGSSVYYRKILEECGVTGKYD